MKKITLIVLIITLLFTSCAKGISPFQAANGKAKCGGYINFWK